MESDFKKIIDKLGQDKIINENSVPAYELIFQNTWPTLANKIIQLIQSSKVKEVVSFKKTYSHLIDQGIVYSLQRFESILYVLIIYFILGGYNSSLALFALPLYMTVKKPFGKDLLSDSFILLIKAHTHTQIGRAHV